MTTISVPSRSNNVADRRAVPVGPGVCVRLAGAAVAASLLAGAILLSPGPAQADPCSPFPACEPPPRPFPVPAPAPMPKLPVAPKPLAGPGVSWNPTLGGLIAHVNDRSGVASECTYKSDWYERGFFLPANGTYDVVIVPAIPKLANWDVTVTCGNGTSTHTSTFF